MMTMVMKNDDNGSSEIEGIFFNCTAEVIYNPLRRRGWRRIRTSMVRLYNLIIARRWVTGRKSVWNDVTTDVERFDGSKEEIQYPVLESCRVLDICLIEVDVNLVVELCPHEIWHSSKNLLITIDHQKLLSLKLNFWRKWFDLSNSVDPIHIEPIGKHSFENKWRQLVPRKNSSRSM